MNPWLYSSEIERTDKDKSYIGGIPIDRSCGESVMVSTSSYAGKYKLCFMVSIHLVSTDGID